MSTFKNKNVSSYDAPDGFQDELQSSSASPLAAKDKDDTYEIYKEVDNCEVSGTEARKVLRTIDVRILPIILATYMLQYLDKAGINFAAVYGLQKGTGLHGQDYSWVGSIFYFGYLIALFPGSYAMQRWPLGKCISTATILWGAIMMSTAGCTTFAGLATNRFFLGLTESFVNPGFVMMMSIWYTSAEQPFRLEIYYSMLGISTMFGGLLAYAIGHIKSSLQQWQYIFLVFGAISVLCGLWSIIALPDLPSSAKFLNSRQKIVAVHRTAANRQGVKNRHFKWYQAKQAFLDPKTWMLCLLCLGGSLPNAAITSFASIIIKSFNYDTLQAQYLQIPGGAIQFIGPLVAGWFCTHYSGRFPIRTIVMAIGNTVALLGAALLVGLPRTNKWGGLVALWLCYFQTIGFSLSFTIISSNVAGYTKKSVTASLYFTTFCIGNIISPQAFRSSEAPGYHTAYIVMLVGYALKLAMVFALWLYMRRQNRMRDRGAGLPVGLPTVKGNPSSIGEISQEEREAIEKGMRDCTELDNPGFRYIL